MIGIYKITSPSGKIYIGQSVNIERRINDYKYKLAKEQPKLHNSFIKHGFDNHIFQILVECDVSELNDKERYFQEFYDCIGENGLNLCYVKSSDKNGFHSEETKIKISKNNAKNMLGKKMSEEAKQNLRDKNLGKKQSIETINKRINSTKGQKRKPLSNETKEKLRLFNTGKKITEETRLKLKLSYNNSDEIKSKRTKGIQDYYSKNKHPFFGVKQSKENILKRKQGKCKEIIVDLSTGVFFFSILEVSNAYGIVNSTMWRYLNGKVKNKTNLIKL